MFLDRHIGPNTAEAAEMLAACDVKSIEELLEESLPPSIYGTAPALNLPPPLSEAEVLERLDSLAGKNQVFTSMQGLGYYDTFLPPVIRRNVLENPAWYSAYTPYQPEISQGRLELLLAFQTMICELTGMELANASLLDEATAAAEAMTLLARVADSNSNRFGVDELAYPQTLGVLKTRAEPLGIELVPTSILEIPDDCFGVFLQLETAEGQLQNLEQGIKNAQKKGSLVSIAADPLALCLVLPPGEQGADVVVGNTQRFGVPLGFGGPHAAYIATRNEYKRALPGRLVGTSKDSMDRESYRLALQTREQHIRKEKATSNICTAQVLLAIVSVLYGMYHGPAGLTKIAQHTHTMAQRFASALTKKGFAIKHSDFFGTLAIQTNGVSTKSASQFCENAKLEKINLRQLDEDSIAIAFDETTTETTLQKLCAVFGVESDSSVDLDATKIGIPAHLRRKSEPLTHPMFLREWSETEFVRYLKQLADKDLALDHSMIPLGSCTMKLNSATELSPISFPEFARIHPLAPPDQVQGYLELFKELEHSLKEITGMDAASLQPNAGSQGELAGLLAIRNYHQADNKTPDAPERDLCLIPISAHGTNSASAIMAGFQVMPVKCSSNGNVDIADLAEKVAKHSDRIAALMITYPSTHGIFEPEIKEICELVHSCGGQVYMDGANLNALIGLARPGDFGVDVSHLNLHKTFCIPHGGGGPGVGPIVAKKHLEPYLPSHPFISDNNDDTNIDAKGDLGAKSNIELGGNAGPVSVGPVSVGPVSAAPWGSAGILPISWSYIQLMGASGLEAATKMAILNANYLASQLANYFPILYTGLNNRVAHECVLDFRAFRNFVTVEDVAKRLMDYGFHAPTVSFPVADTLMVEPTESESKAELDRFIDAMASIAQEIQEISSGQWDPENNPLKNAPHPAQDVISDSWDRPYSRELAAYPLPHLRTKKYWPPISRIDSAWGDRNLFCTCPLPDRFEASDHFEATNI